MVSYEVVVVVCGGRVDLPGERDFFHFVREKSVCSSEVVISLALVTREVNSSSRTFRSQDWERPCAR